MLKSSMTLFSAAAVLTLAALTPAHAAVDVDAAKALFKENECSKCHDAKRAKKGPALKKTAAKYKGKPEGQAEVIKFFTTAHKVKTSDGKELDHKVLDSKDLAEQKNLADWILSQ